MLDKIAQYLKKVIFPISMVLTVISMLAIIFAILVVVADVILRRVFRAPILGSHDLTMLAFSIIVFLPLGWQAFNDGHIELDFLVKKFPLKVQRTLEVIMTFMTTVLLGLMSWRLLALGIMFQERDVATSILQIPQSPFVFLASLGSIILTLAFLVRFLKSISIMIEERR